jgi:hypothetical protein
MSNLEDDIVVLGWTFAPPDYFEEPIQIKRDDYVMTIGNGTVETRIMPELYDKDQGIRDRLHSALNDRFLGVQVFSHKPYELSEASMYRLHRDGRKDVTIFPESCLIKVLMGKPDIIVKDKDGNVIGDSSQERIQKKQEWADLAEKYRKKDSVVASILRSYNEAVNDVDNEFLHLYEIREAIEKHLGGASAAQSILGICGKQWSRLGRLANDEPLKQGRHRGKNLGVLRDATEGELREARSIARNIVEAYLDYLESLNEC